MKKINLLVMLFFIAFMGIINIKAITLTHSNSPSYEYEGVSVYDKKLDGVDAYCLSGVDVQAAPAGTKCTYKGENVMVGAIISQSCYVGDVACYVIRELAIASYLGEKTSSATNNPSQSLINQYENLKNSATSGQNQAIYESEFSILFADPNSDSAVNSLNFTVDGDYYKSQTIKILGEHIEGTVNKQVTGVNGAIIEGDDSSFYIKIPRKNVNSATTATLTISAKQSPYYSAEVYSCGEDQNGKPYQDIARLKTEQRKDSKSISGSIVPKGTITINKVDENGNHLSGATIFVSKAGGEDIGYTTKNEALVIDNLEYGNYGISETTAPAGYALSEKSETRIIDKDHLEYTITIVNKLIKIDILKIDENNKPLRGAIIKLMDKNGNTLEICKDENGNNSSCRWTTTDKAYRIEGIPAGTYYLKEISTPKGYNVNPNKIKIVIDNYGKVKIDNKELNDNLIKISNELTTTKISKISAVNSKELPGATLEILNSKKEKIACIIKNDKGEKETLKECKWVSKDKPTYVLGLESGKYYLSETIAPEGYELNKNMVEFEIKADGSVTEVEMKNELSVKVPDTLSARSALLIAISMFDIALGIGIITYVKKNKVEE